MRSDGPFDNLGSRWPLYFLAVLLKLPVELANRSAEGPHSILAPAFAAWGKSVNLQEHVDGKLQHSGHIVPRV